MPKRRHRAKALPAAMPGMSFYKDKPVHVNLHVEAENLHDAARQIKHHLGKLGVKRGRKPGPTSIAQALSE